jgi:iron complex transport system ATP-binding protein
MSLRARGVTVRYGRSVAVDGVTLDVEPGEVLAILGANGSGKSSLLRALAGVQPCEGTLTWDGQAVPGRGIGYMPQDNALRAALTAFEVVLLGRLRSLTFRVGEPDLAAARAALTELGLSSLAPRRIDELSGGQRQLVFLAQVLAADPQVLLLDEPTSALDIAHQLQVLALLRDATTRRGLTTVVVLHDLNAAARFADRIALMRAGRLIGLGCPSEVLTATVLRDAYGVNVSILNGPDGHPVVVPVHTVEVC